MTVIPETEVRLLSNVPLSNDYEHQRTFASLGDQETYFLGKVSHTFLDFTYQREEVSIKVPKGYDSLYNTNYLMYKNKDYSSKWFYAFITRKEYVNPNTTRIYFEIDVYQTWQFDLQFKPSFVVREHRNRWNADGSPVVHTVDEGLDYGSEYETAQVIHHTPYPDNIVFMVIVAKEVMHGGSTTAGKITPMTNATPQPLAYYVHPISLNGGSPQTTIDGTSISISTAFDVLRAMYTQTGAVNNIVNIYITDYIGVNLTYSNGVLSFPSSWFDHATVQDDTTSVNTIYLKSASKYVDKVDNLGNKYDGFDTVSESKLLMHPYTVTILTDLKGNVQEIKPEYIEGDGLSIRTKGSMGTSNKLSYSVENYLGKSGTTVLENAIINQSANDIPIVTELLSAYLQGNRNQLDNQKNSIVANSVANLFGNALGTLGSAMARNPVGAVGGLAGMATGTMNSYFQLEGMIAKKQDLSAVPPQLSSMGGNTAFDYGNDVRGLYIIKKQITANARKRLEDFFKMYGYKINELKVPNLKTRFHFNFVQTVGANIQGNIPHDDLQRLKGIFNNGVTLWHGDFVGDYSLANGER